jgi:hypothetical protein
VQLVKAALSCVIFLCVFEFRARPWQGGKTPNANVALHHIFRTFLRDGTNRQIVWAWLAGGLRKIRA